MVVSLLDKTLNEDSYDEYIEKIINIFRLSSKESSIIFDIKIKNGNCTIRLSIVNQNGEREEFNDTTLKCDEVFYEKFLDNLVDKFTIMNEIVTKDIVNFNDEEFVTLRLITNNNDLFSIGGLNEDHAKKLLRLDIDEKQVSEIVPDNKGIGRALSFIFMIIAIVVVFMLIIWLID